ncbi:calcium/calmodulin-dependent protein kinase type IV-like isoform X1 [Macrosteles quadrilineatus]|uniref:calcium/calmodulin-dependent protein kinase type IV-like isoform X1 n=1 Tax=Macrosteles quadrilineatus TaxID=74068 RepID=UPI0023E09CFB|nr:calcium/calmodulin-dependent protein kinase type IV-like isoform X1 [Macrosteles quadrilineatus]
MDDSVSWLSPSDSGHTSLEDSYIVGVLIGRGSYSMVHKCLHKGKTERACKVYKKAHLEPKSVPSHISTILKLNHPHLACVHEVFEMPHELQVVVDLMTGEELLERIERSEHYSEKDASRVVCTILSVLQYLHSQQLPHGSVYPENLLYESEAPNAKLKLSEISIPKMSHSPTTLSIYIAPEFNCEMSKSKLRCSADIWSLGILIFIIFVKDYKTVFETILIQTVPSYVAIICFAAFQAVLALERQDYPNMAQNMFMVAVIVSHLFTFCYPGQHIYNKSEQFRNSLYCSHWEDQSVSFQKSVIIMMTATICPITISFKGIVTSSMLSFEHVLQTAFSYVNILMVLKNIN